MAKKSMIAREVKRMKTVQKYAEKRSLLKKIMNDQNLSSEERYDAVSYTHLTLPTIAGV